MRWHCAYAVLAALALARPPFAGAVVQPGEKDWMDTPFTGGGEPPLGNTTVRGVRRVGGGRRAALRAPPRMWALPDARAPPSRPLSTPLWRS